ncbi:MAG: T9SS type A sorting domain-containing protein [Candidatus Zixiibacteriota bacterium]
MPKFKVLILSILCIMLLALPVSAKYKVKIDEVPGVYGGYFTYISVNIEPLGDPAALIDLGGFDLMVSYNGSRLTCLAAERGLFLNECDWEYFTYRHSGSASSCYYGESSASLMQVIALAETTSPGSPSCYKPDDLIQLFKLQFLATSEYSAAFTTNPINFYWYPEDYPDGCVFNVFSDITGNQMLIADEVTDWQGNSFASEYNCSGPDPLCVDNGTPYIDFQGGYIYILGDEEPTDRGDINLDGVPYDIADAQVFTNYFISGLSAFQIDVYRQVMATEINCDQITLTVSDLVYLIRIIVGDAYPLYNCDPPEKADFDNPPLALTDPSVTDTMKFIGGEALAGQQNVAFELYTANVVDLGGLQARIEYDPAKLTPHWDEVYNDGMNVSFALLGRAVGFDNEGVAQVISLEPGELLVYMYPGWYDYTSKIDAGSGSIMSIYFDIAGGIDPVDTSAFSFVTEGYYYNLFSTFYGQVIWPTLVDGQFIGYNNHFAFPGAEGYRGQINIPFYFEMVSTDSIGELFMDIEYDDQFLSPHLIPDSTLPDGMGLAVRHNLLNRALLFEDEGTSEVLVGMPEEGRLKIWFRPTGTWEDGYKLPIGWGSIIKVYFDATEQLVPIFPLPVTFDPAGTNYMKFWDETVIYPPTIDGEFQFIPKPLPPSCPVLYAYNGQEYVRDNPLLTACQASNYVAAVTDYYQVTAPVDDADGRVSFQIRELEDEITYIEYIDLITVDHAANTKLACAVDGRIYTYNDVLEPLSAVDNLGNDRLAELRTVDENYFAADQSGYLIVTFPNIQGKETGYSLSAYSECNEPIPIEPGPWLKGGIADQDENIVPVQLKVEVLDASGNWVEFPTIPYREKETYEVVTCEPGITDGLEEITLRISWEGSYMTDAVNQFVASDETPMVDTWKISDYRFSTSLSPVSPLKNGVDGQTVTMVKGDVFDIHFDCDALLDPQQTRDYIIRIIGRYEPVENIDQYLTPEDFRLYENYPNPFNPTTTISYDLPTASQVKLEIINLLGQRVATLVDGYQTAGHQQIDWNGRNDAGQTVSSGVYFYRLTADNYVQTKKMILLK